MGTKLNHTADLDAVDAYLADCVRQALAGEPWRAWPSEWHSPEAHKAIIKRCHFHGISTILAVSHNAYSGWPKSVSEPLLFEARLASVWEESHKKTLIDLFANLADAGIEATVMKGTALAYLVYDPASMRRRGDTDLLIGIADLERTRRLLKNAGFSTYSSPHGLYSQESWQLKVGHHLTHIIDLHWEPTDRPVLQRILRFEDFFQNRVALERLGSEVYGPSPVQMLIQGALNQAWHTSRGYNVAEDRILGGRRLVWQVDYTKLLKRFNDQLWDELIQVCRERDARSIVYAALAGTQKDLCVQIPERVMEDLNQSPKQSPTHCYIMEPESALTKLRDINVASSMSKRRKILKMAVFPPRDHLVSEYPELAHWPTFALQLRRYASSIVRVFKQFPSR
ncbi:MAG: nucleotidyltransferase family protein [Pseudomonadota bacterium]